jgi:hypothetical protein
MASSGTREKKPVDCRSASPGRSTRGRRIEEECSTGRDRRQHGVHPDAVVQPNVHARRRLVDVPPSERDEAHRKVAQLRLAQGEGAISHEAVAAVDPQFSRTIDEDVGHRRVRHERTEIAELRQLLAGDAESCRNGPDFGGRLRGVRRPRPSGDESLWHPLLGVGFHGSRRHRFARVAGGRERVEPVEHRSKVASGTRGGDGRHAKPGSQEGAWPPGGEEGRRRLGGTDAATATLDWGESLRAAYRICIRRLLVYSSKPPVQERKSTEFSPLTGLVLQSRLWDVSAHSIVVSFRDLLVSSSPV